MASQRISTLSQSELASLEQYISTHFIEELSSPQCFSMAKPICDSSKPTDLGRNVKKTRLLKRSRSSSSECVGSVQSESDIEACDMAMPCAAPTFDEGHESRLNERMKHLSDTFSEYLLYLIETRGLNNADVYKNAVVDKKVFSKIKSNPSYHPNKMTAMCLCIGARLNLDESRDLLARAGYALSPCDRTDVIFSYFIENEIYDMIELDIQLEEHGERCLIS